ncbi:dynein axonemal assembly factor 4-like isoform X2 [Babylonia areolata]|uniref:dynein axonemal assembly factor 4-like isoform X2 n=1 Tax=Babylonia areolata TaxID=304850 RepID=UPI003FD51C7E
MPLIVKDYVWEETEKSVFITVPLKGVKANKADILSSEEYLKVSYPPYIFECLLNAQVDDTHGTAQIGSGAVLFKLNKKEPALWGRLQSPYVGDKEIMRCKREEAIENTRKRTEEDLKQKEETKRKNEKYAIQEMMKLEEAERTRIETRKQEERDKATADLEAWKETQRLLAEQEKERLLKEKQEQEKAQRKEKHHRRGGSIFMEAANEMGGNPKRMGGKIEVSFTERVFPTPVRESTKMMEDEWLQKQAEARQIADLQDCDLTEEERNPQFLRDKGNSFFAAGNFQAAVNVYTHALRLNPKMPSLYSNRAACHLKLRNLFKCIEDCSKAMDLLSPPVPQNEESRVKALVRRGTAFCQLEMYVEGLQDYEAALKMDPNNQQLKEDAEKMRQIIQGNMET